MRNMGGSGIFSKKVTRNDGEEYNVRKVRKGRNVNFETVKLGGKYRDQGGNEFEVRKYFSIEENRWGIRPAHMLCRAFGVIGYIGKDPIYLFRQLKKRTKLTFRVIFDPKENNIWRNSI